MRLNATTPELLALRAPRHDFPRMLHDLMRYITRETIAELCQRGKNSVDNWRRGESIPRHHEGETILALHRHFYPEGR